MTRPKLTYFDFAASRGEECRVALHLAGVDFEDNRIQREAWSELKKTTPYGKLPLFEIPGKPPLAQSSVILRVIGEHHDLHPKDLWEAAQHESVMAACEEVRAAFAGSLYMKDEEQKKAERERVLANTLPPLLGGINDQIGDGPFLAGDQINVADIKVWMVAKWLGSGVMDHVPAECLDDYPNIKKLEAAVNEHEGVKAWYAK